MQKKRSDAAWLLDESKALVQCGIQAWTMVPAWHRAALGAASVMMAINSVANIYQALLLGQLVDRIHNGLGTVPEDALFWSAMQLLGIIALLYLIRETLNVLRRYTVENSCTTINRDMQLRVVRHVMKYDMQQLQGEKLGTLHGKIFRSVDGLVQFVRLMFLDFLPAIFLGLFALGAAVWKQQLLGLVMVGVVPLSVFLTLRQLKTQKGVRLQLMRDCEEVDGALVEQLSGVEYIRVANTIEPEMQRLGELTDRRRRRELKHHFEMSLFGSGKAINEGFFHLCVLALATSLAIKGQITFGDILAFSALYGSVMSPLNEIHRVVDVGHESSLRMSDLYELLNRPSDIAFDTLALDQPLPMQVQPIIAVENLTASYRTASGQSKQVLHNVSFEINPGQAIGIAGQSGGGKSSMIKVLLRLLHPTGGDVQLSGKNLAQIDRRCLADLIGYVGQNPFVFAGTIAENIAYGSPLADEKAIHAAAKAAHIDREILEMDGGFAALVSERGNNLSGGQRQRLAIARLLLKNAPVLILDEATSALDNISERHIQGALGLRSGRQTVIMIAHRLTTLRHCDKILVFDNGHIVESGPYDQLIVSNGKFAELLRASEDQYASVV